MWKACCIIVPKQHSFQDTSHNLKKWKVKHPLLPFLLISSQLSIPFDMKFALYVLAALLSAAPLSEGKKLKGYRKPASTIVETGMISLIDTIPRVSLLCSFHQKLLQMLTRPFQIALFVTLIEQESDASTSVSASIGSHLDDSRGDSTTDRSTTIGGIRASDSDLNSAQRELASMDSFSDELDKPFAAFQQCFESCGVPWKLEAFGREDDSTDSVTADSEKPSCCKGGVSAIKMVYSGVNGATLFLPDDESLANSPILDPCEGDGESSKKPKKSDDAWLVKFADCDRCFPKDGSPVMSCDPSTDIWESVGVDEHDEVCVISYDDVTSAAAFDVKMPTNLILYYHLVDSVTIGSLNIHTSCSKVSLSCLFVLKQSLDNPKFSTHAIFCCSSPSTPLTQFNSGFVQMMMALTSTSLSPESKTCSLILPYYNLKTELVPLILARSLRHAKRPRTRTKTVVTVVRAS
jgi:hypothetical protein